MKHDKASYDEASKESSVNKVIGKFWSSTPDQTSSVRQNCVSIAGELEGYADDQEDVRDPEATIVQFSQASWEGDITIGSTLNIHVTLTEYGGPGHLEMTVPGCWDGADHVVLTAVHAFIGSLA